MENRISGILRGPSENAYQWNSYQQRPYQWGTPCIQPICFLPNWSWAEIKCTCCSAQTAKKLNHFYKASHRRQDLTVPIYILCRHANLGVSFRSGLSLDDSKRFPCHRIKHLKNLYFSFCSHIYHILLQKQESDCKRVLAAQMLRRKCIWLDFVQIQLGSII